jgi:hypothetical protein
MIIGEFGRNFMHTVKLDYLSNRSLIDFDFLILDTDAMKIDHNNRAIHYYEKRKTEIEEFMNLKRVPLIILSPNTSSLSFQNSNGQLIDHHISSLLPIPNFKTENEFGQKFLITSKNSLSSFFDKYQDLFAYKVIFTEHNGTITTEVPMTKKVLSFYNDKSVFLPHINKSLKDKEQEFLTDLYNGSKAIIEKNKTKLPEWSNSFYLPKEQEIRNDISKTKQKILDLQQELEGKEKTIIWFEDKKILFTGSGDELENEIEVLLEELGFKIIEADRNRDDLIVQFADHIAVIEIKGVNSSAAEKHAAQLEKWVAGYLEKNGVKPKGILIVNSFKDKKLDERNETSFPDQMLNDYCIPRKHCLITSLQLLGLYYEAINHPDKKGQLIKSLFDTIGVYQGFKNWNEFITL